MDVDFGYMSTILNGELSKHSSIGEHCSLNNLELGSYSYMANHTSGINTRIGKFCSVGSHCRIGLATHPISGASTSPAFYTSNAPNGGQFGAGVVFDELPMTRIGSDVWIGNEVSILAGVTIGNGAVIGAKCLVNRDVLPYEVVAGVPCRHLRMRFDEESISFLQSLEWWNKSTDWLRQHGGSFANINELQEVLDDSDSKFTN